MICILFRKRSQSSIFHSNNVFTDADIPPPAAAAASVLIGTTTVLSQK